MNRWYVVQTQVRREAVAAQHLRNQGFDVYLPHVRRRRRHARRIDSVLGPMFPRYLFVKMDADSCRWRSINGTVGIARLVSFGDEPAAVPHGVVEEIIANEGDDGAVMPKARTFNKGECLRVTDGALAEQTGLFEEMADDQRVFLLLDLLGRQVRVKVPASYLATA